MHCTQCQRLNEDGARFCNGCGGALPLGCPSCRASNPPDSNYCSTCGNSLTNREERLRLRRATPRSYTPHHLAERILTSRSALEGECKQVTVLFADVVGFSTMAESLDPEAVHDIMDGCFEILTRSVHAHEGTINQFTGDGIMALFGAPLTHEDHAERCLNASLEIQQALRDYAKSVERQWSVPFRLRIGVNTGTVVVGKIGDNLRMDYTAQGDTTNLAARLQQMAPPGAIWIGEAAYRLGRDAFEWRELGPVSVKGRRGTILAYELLGKQAYRSRFELAARRGLSRMVGRADDLAQLVTDWDAARHGQGRVVSVVGEAGIGKSRLLHEFKREVLQAQGRVVEGSCLSNGESIPYFPLRDVVRELVEVEDGSDAAATLSAIERRLAKVGVDEEVAPFVAHVVGVEEPHGPLARLPANILRQRAVDAMRALVLSEASFRPLVVVLEDIHWGDPASGEVIAALSDSMAAAPLLLVLVHRPTYEAPATPDEPMLTSSSPAASLSGLVGYVLSKPYARQLKLNPLETRDGLQLAREILEIEALPEELEQLVSTKTEGNPFFVEELLRSLLETGQIDRDDGTCVVHSGAELPRVPTHVQGVILARIDRLDEDAKQLLQVASVVGRVFSLPVLERLMPDDADLNALLESLERLQFVYTARIAPQREYSFRHALTQETVYGTLLRSRRQGYHRQIGAAVEEIYTDRVADYYEVLAYHYVRSTDRDKAVDYLCQASLKVARTNAMVQAKRYFDEAMGLLDRMEDNDDNRRKRVSLLIHHGAVHWLLCRFREYRELLQRYERDAIELGDTGLLGAYYARLGWCAWSAADFDSAITVLQEAARLSEDAGNSDDAGLAYCRWQWSHLDKGDFEEVFALERVVQRALKASFHPRWSVFARGAASLAHLWKGQWRSALEEGEAALDVARRYSDDSLTSYSAWVLSLVNSAMGRHDEAVECGRLAVREASTVLDRTLAQAALGTALSRADASEEGVQLLSAASAQLRAAGVRSPESVNLYLAEGQWRRGDHESALRTLDSVLATARQCGMRHLTGAAHRLLGEVTASRAEPDWAGATAHYHSAIEMLEEVGAAHELALAHDGLGRLLGRRGDPEGARRQIEKALATFERLGSERASERSRRTLERLGSGDPAERR